MSIRSRFALFVCVLFTFSALSGQEKTKDLHMMILEGIEDWHIPGMTAIVVQNGEVVFSEVYGVTHVGSKTPVNRETLFNMGSTTKAMVAMALGILVDQGKLQWTDRVRKHLPEFQLSDPYITEEARVQDLLTHNLGIAGADMLWFLDSVSTTQTLKRFALAPKDYPLRGGFQYNNLMYVAAGEVIHSVSGMPWSEFVKKHLFEPLEMERTVARASDIFKAGNYVTPYYYTSEEGYIEVPHNLSDQIGAAGMIWTCTADIEHYLQMLAGKGVYKGKIILKPETFQYLFEPQTLIPRASFYPTQALTQPNWTSYGLGWFQHDYRGEKLDFHTGSIGGLVAIAGVIHEKNTAVYFLANRDHAELRHAFMYKALDLWAFEDGGRPWHKEIYALYEGLQKENTDNEMALVEKRVQNTRPSMPLSAYSGTYTHPMLGSAVVRNTPSSLQVRFNDFLGYGLEHWHYDTFRSSEKDNFQQRPVFNFTLGAEGQIKAMDAFGETFTKIKP
ncbi:MAG: serine hydrolase [Robiginitalea sp.]|uniref:serine hydrolase n=1 Tax=Robiginitalea sp. TaxID=1902411 RepID=UPI003C784081